MVPIVTGERRKARTAASETPGKRRYRPKSAARPRLCADDVMSHVRPERPVIRRHTIKR